jgi:hypothetical protein
VSLYSSKVYIKAHGEHWELQFAGLHYPGDERAISVRRRHEVVGRCLIPELLFDLRALDLPA